MKRPALPLLVILATLAASLSCNKGQGYDAEARAAYNCAMRMYSECDTIYNMASQAWATAWLSPTERHASKEAAHDALDRLLRECRDGGALDTLDVYRGRLMEAMAALSDPPADRRDCRDNLQSLANNVILMQTIVTCPKEAGDLSSYKEQVEILDQDIIKKSKYYLTHCSNNE